MGSVNITLTNGRLGAGLQTADGVAGLVLNGVAVEDGYSLGTPILITALDDLKQYGITKLNNAFAYRQVKEFYDEAGIGAQLYLMLLDPLVTVADMADYSNTQGARRLLEFANGKIKLLGIMSDDYANIVATGSEVTILNALNSKVYTAAVNMKVMAQAFFAMQKPFRAIIGGSSYTGIHTALDTLNEGTDNNRTAILVGDTTDGIAACLGLALGRLAAVPVMRKISRVRTGALSNTQAYLAGAALNDAPGAATIIAQKGFITWCTYPNISGYFFSGDDTCSAPSDDYHFLSRGRVIDKAHILAYTTFVQQVDDEIPINEDGTLDAGFCNWLSQQIINRINNAMTANKEISSVNCVIDPTQNVLSTNILNVVVSIVPIGYASAININLGFDNPSIN